MNKNLDQNLWILDMTFAVPIQKLMLSKSGVSDLVLIKHWSPIKIFVVILNKIGYKKKIETILSNESKFKKLGTSTIVDFTSKIDEAT